MATKDPYVVTAAIDFGTTFSGFAFQMTKQYIPEDPTMNIFCPQSWNKGQTQLVSMKTPTCLLLDQNQDIDSFGYEAEEKYADLCMDNDHANWYFFRRFKMQLYDTKSLTKHTQIEDETGKKLPALKVFSSSIECLMIRFKEILDDKNIVLVPGNVQWVLTVPAIWDDTAKQFMREAAEIAKIPPEHLTIALEPEAASLYCQYLPVKKFCVGGQVKFSDARPGTTYMIVDLGGGTADITVHEKISNGKLKEIHRASGGPWGGTAVDGAFISLLSEIVGGPVFATFMRNQKYDYLDLMRNFEAVKRNVSTSTTDDVRLKLPVSLNETCLGVVNKDFRALVKAARKDKQISFISDKIKINADVAKGLFKKVTDKIVTHMKKILDGMDVGKKVGLILMVGGFSESPFVQDVIKNEFHDKKGRKVLIPSDAGISVLNGAVVYGRQPGNITSRVLQFSYGITVLEDFDNSIHPLSKMKTFCGQKKCDDVFGKFIDAGTEVERNQVVKRNYFAISPFQDVITLNVYSSTDNNTRYTDEDSCRHLGLLSVRIPNPSEKLHEITTEFKFGDTELHVTALETDSGTSCNTTLKMLE